jgi:D-aminoacyl-tRNA deacylase
MSALAVDRGLDDEYDLTLETTHHGPTLTKPTLYIEIGSTSDQWGDERAARVWADALSACLGLSGGNQVGTWQGHGDVMIGLGGGHYAPRHRAVISQTDVWVGHLLANYALAFDEPTVEEELPGGLWKHAVTVAIEATRFAFPGGSVFAHLDRKSFKGWQRQSLASLLFTLDVPIRRGKQIP